MSAADGNFAALCICDPSTRRIPKVSSYNSYIKILNPKVVDNLMDNIFCLKHFLRKCPIWPPGLGCHEKKNSFICVENAL